MEPDFIRFRLPVSWDLAARVLKRAARHGRTGLETHKCDNGYLRLRRRRAFHATTVLDIMFITESPTSTIVIIVDVTGRVRHSHRQQRQVRALMEALQSDTEFFAKLFGDEGCSRQPGGERMRTSTLSHAEVVTAR